MSVHRGVVVQQEFWPLTQGLWFGGFRRGPWPAEGAPSGWRLGVPLCPPARVSPGGWGSRGRYSERGDETLGVQEDSVSRGGQDEAHAAASEAATSRAASDLSWTWLIYADLAAPAPLLTCPLAPQTTQPHRRLATHSYCLQLLLQNIYLI